MAAAAGGIRKERGAQVDHPNGVLKCGPCSGTPLPRESVRLARRSNDFFPRIEEARKHFDGAVGEGVVTVPFLPRSAIWYMPWGPSA